MLGTEVYGVSNGKNAMVKVCAQDRRVGGFIGPLRA